MNTPKIESYRFGYIRIDGIEHHKDVIILPDRVISNWWRSEGHSLHKNDLQEVFEGCPEILVIGRGSVSRMKVPKETEDALTSAGIEVKSMPTKEACSYYNQLRVQRKTAAAMHLTC